MVADFDGACNRLQRIIPVALAQARALIGLTIRGAVL
jgi:hypothetical protein